MLWIVLVLVVVFWGYIKVSPVSATTFHTDPETIQIPKFPGHFHSRVTVDLPVEQSAKKLQAVILATPRTTQLSGDLFETFASFVTRSAFWGFADVANVKIKAVSDTESEVIIFSRLRHGYADMGVNEKRVKAWLTELQAR